MNYLTNGVTKIASALARAVQAGLPAESHREAAEKMYDYEEMIVELANNVPDETQQDTSSAQLATVERVKPLDIKITPFEGERSKYAMFKRSIEVVMEQRNETPEHRLVFLNQHLKGEAAAKIDNLLPTAENYTTAWQILDDEYNDPTKINEEVYIKLEKLPRAEYNPQSLRNTYDQIESILRIMETYSSEKEVNSNDTYRRKVLSKFPVSILRNIARADETLSLELARKRLRTTIKLENDVYSLSEASKHSSSIVFATSANSSKNVEANKNQNNDTRNDHGKPSWKSEQKKRCHFCQKDHWSSECTTYPTAKERAATLPPKSCFGCLQNHQGKRCNRTRKCKCGSYKHHRALCPDDFGYISERKKPEDSKDLKPSTAPVATKSVNLIRPCTSFHNTVTATIQNPKTKRTVLARALLDGGSPDTFILDETANKIGLPHLGSTKVDFATFGNKNMLEKTTNTVQFALKFEHQEIKMYADTVDYIQDQITVCNIETFKEAYPNFAGFNFADQGDGAIELLIGADFLYEVETAASRICVAKGLHLVPSTFGWLISGRMELKKRNSTVVLMTSTKAIEQLWELDTLGIKEKDLSKEKEEELALESFYKNIKYDENEKRFQISWPWRTYPPPISDNFGLAIGVLRSVLKKTHPDHLQTVK